MYTIHWFATETDLCILYSSAAKTGAYSWKTENTKKHKMKKAPKLVILAQFLINVCCFDRLMEYSAPAFIL